LAQRFVDPLVCVQVGGASPLCIAGTAGHVEVVNALLDGGADINQTSVCVPECACVRVLVCW
jgi:hypothetical protein